MRTGRAGFHLFVIIGIVCTSVFSAFLVLYATQIAPWAFSDSAAYLATARSLAHGGGLGFIEVNGKFTTLTWYPPLYPMLLALPAAAGISALEAARWLNVICYSIFLGGCGWLLYRLTFPSLFPLLFCLSGLAYADLLQVFTGAMSEGLFLALGFPGLLLLLYGLKKRSQLTVGLAALLLGLSMLTRYIGIAFLLSGFVMVLLFAKSSWRERAMSAFSFALIGGLPNLIWLGWVLISIGKIGGRELMVVNFTTTVLRGYEVKFLSVVTPWFPYISRGGHFPTVEVRIILIMLLFLIGLVFAIRQQRDKESDHNTRAWLALSMVILSIAYILFHLGAFLFSNAPPHISARLLSPLLIAGILAWIGLGGMLESHRWAMILCACYLILGIQYQIPRLREYALNMHDHSSGYTEKNVLSSELVLQAKLLPTETVIYSNEPYLYLLLMERTPKTIENRPAEPGSRSYVVIFQRFLYDRYGKEKADNILDQLGNACSLTFRSETGNIYSCGP